MDVEEKRYLITRDGRDYSRTPSKELAEQEAERLFILGHSSQVLDPSGTVICEFEV